MELSNGKEKRVIPDASINCQIRGRKGNFENDVGTVMGNITTYTGGGASDNTGNNYGNCESR